MPRARSRRAACWGSRPPAGSNDQPPSVSRLFRTTSASSARRYRIALLALVVIPEIRISDLGLVDVTRFELTKLFE